METQIAPSRAAHDAKLKQQIDDWNAKLEALKVKAAKAEAQAKAELHKVVEQLSRLQESAKRELDKLTSASAETWKEVQHGVENTWNEVASAIESAWKSVG